MKDRPCKHCGKKLKLTEEYTRTIEHPLGYWYSIEPLCKTCFSATPFNKTKAEN